MIIYFPVSALVTLFANVLQNPQDGRARQDVRLMSIVCSFLSTLGHDKENGSIKRLLCVCSEFERIARVVLQKSERDNSSRRKRKSHAEDPNESHASNVPIPGNPTTPGNVFTASSSLDQSVSSLSQRDMNDGLPSSPGYDTTCYQLLDGRRGTIFLGSS
jgi:hypothetical protein